IAQYQFQDVGGGATSGHFTLNGITQPQGDATFTVSAAQLGQLRYAGGSVAGSEAVWVRASDGTTFGDWKRFMMSTGTVYLGPVVMPKADTQTVVVNHSVDASSLFGAIDPDGDAIAQYQFQDVGGGATSGHFTLNGVTQAQGDATFAVSAAQFGQLQYTGGSVAGSEAVWARASDGTNFGDWQRFVMSTLAA
ncbi:MAG TPA: hypothetical protein VKF40_27690, partial [Burkholderiales bacterium]|nr:hypothetical protein [Burkholderiales bacterium]